MTREQDILAAYSENPNAVFSINELAKRTGKAYPSINRAVKELVEKGILKQRAMGRSHLCSPNLENKQTVMLLALHETRKHDTLPEHIVRAAADVRAHKNSHYVHIMVYDPGTDALLLVTENTLATHFNAPPLHLLTREELKARLLDNEGFYREHIVLEGYERFFRIIAETDIARRYHPLL